MAENLLRSESAVEYFRELVDVAMRHQQLSAGESTSFYLVNLLAGFVHRDQSAGNRDEALGVQLAKALQADSARQREGLRDVGDRSLFISGFFADSLNRSLVDIDYYIRLGGYAYGCLARQREDALGEVFDELAEKFSALVGILEEVSEQAAVTSNADLLRLYEKWVRTGGRRYGDLLVARGLVPNPAVRSRLLH
jgi:hypothetical protein